MMKGMKMEVERMLFEAKAAEGADRPEACTCSVRFGSFFFFFFFFTRPRELPRLSF
jgi:hypothetical protein